MNIPTLSGPELAPVSGRVKKLVIFLHGVGSNGDDLMGLAPLMCEALPDTQFLSPNGRQPYDMAPYGFQWFSLTNRSLEAMHAGAQDAAASVNQYIDQQRDRFGLKDADIALLGFSQGTMMALYAGPRRPQPLAAIVGFAGVALGSGAVASKPPVCLVHGEEDMVVPFAALAHSKTVLETAGMAVEAHARPRLGHSIDPEGIDVCVAFLQEHFSD